MLSEVQSLTYNSSKWSVQIDQFAHRFKTTSL